MLQNVSFSTLLLCFDVYLPVRVQDCKKHITGGLLVSLRWWNEIQDDGTNEWQFEDRDINSVCQAGAASVEVVVLGHCGVLLGRSIRPTRFVGHKFLSRQTICPPS